MPFITLYSGFTFTPSGLVTLILVNALPALMFSLKVITNALLATLITLLLAGLTLVTVGFAKSTVNLLVYAVMGLPAVSVMLFVGRVMV